MKIAHVSDIHFFVPTFAPKHLLTNKWIGNLNASLRRKNYFITKHLDQFLASLIKEQVELLIITGDFTTTADPKEFILAKEFIQKVQDAGIKVLATPGNHDTYTKKSFKEKFFYRFIDNLPTYSNGDLHQESLCPSWSLILLDTTMYNKVLRANGKFTSDHEKKLKELLNSSDNVIIGNHFPLSDPDNNHKLFRGKELKETLLSHEKSVLYLHGHTHKTSYHKEEKNLHVFNSSEVTVINNYSYHLITLDNEKFSQKVIKYYER